MRDEQRPRRRPIDGVRPPKQKPVARHPVETEPAVHNRAVHQMRDVHAERPLVRVIPGEMISPQSDPEQDEKIQQEASALHDKQVSREKEEKENFLSRSMAHVEVRREKARRVRESIHNKRMTIFKSIAGAGGAIAIAVFLSFSVFGGVSVEVTPRVVVFGIDEVLPAYREPEKGQLAFTPGQVSHDAEERLSGQTFKESPTYASGTIRVTNENSTAQSFAPKTRFESSGGLVFFAPDKTFIVPGATEKGPGALDIVVTAKEPGTESNIGPDAFVVPGWREQGHPNFKTQTGKSVTAFTGGGVSRVAVLPEKDMSELEGRMTEEIRSALLSNVSDTLKEGTVFIANQASLDIEDVSQAGAGDTILIQKTGVLRGARIELAGLATFIGENFVPGYNLMGVSIENPEQLSFELVGASDKVITEATAVTFRVAGNVELVAKLDTAHIQDALVGKRQKEVDAIMQGLEGVATAHLSVRPRWRSHMPQKKGRIHVTIVEDDIIDKN